MKKPHKVIIASWDEDLAASVSSLSDELPDFEFTKATPRSLAALNGEVVQCAAMLIEVDLGENGAVDEFGALARSMPGQKLIAAVRGAVGGDVRRLFRAGAADVMTAPYDMQSLKAALVEMLQTGPAAPQGAGRVVTVLKAGGGVGATTLALNLAQLMVRGDERRHRPARSAALLDLDLQLGDSDLALSLEPRSTLFDLLGAEERLDTRLLQSVLTEHKHGLKLLAPPRSILPLDALSSRLALKIVEHSSLLHDFTFVDLPGAFADWTLPILARSDLVVLVAVPTVISVMRARRTLEALREAKIHTPVFLTLNQLGGLMDGLDKPERIARSLDMPVDAALGLDPSATRASDRGEFIVEAFPKTRLSRDLVAAAQKIEDRFAVLEQSVRPELKGKAA